MHTVIAAIRFPSIEMLMFDLCFMEIYVWIYENGRVHFFLSKADNVKIQLKGISIINFFVAFLMQRNALSVNIIFINLVMCIEMLHAL